LREVAQVTKINIRYLEAIERNDFAYLPGGLFNRGFVRAYCKHIGVDPEVMVNAYLLEERTQTGSGSAAAADRGLLRGGTVRPGAHLRAAEQTRPTRGSRRRGWLLALMLAAAIIAAGAMVILWVFDDASDPASSRAEPAHEVGQGRGSEGDRA
jgi:cytoskeleton protein RodZ